MSEYLGQHFLVNKEKLKKIAEALELKDGDLVIEIGAGHGELTEELRSTNRELRIIAIEKDKKLAEFLRKKFASDKNIEIIQEDALKFLSSIIHNSLFKIQNYKIVGNIPYYITGRLLRILSELAASPKRGEPRPEISGRENKPSLIVLTIQKEVAERICAQPPKMNLLAAAVQFWAKPKIISYISRKDFRPIPKVDSAIIKILSIAFKQRSLGKCYREGNYYKFIKILFKQPRKTIANNLAEGLKIPKEKIIKNLADLGIKPNERAQNLSMAQLKNFLLF